jgi:F-type H+-transporting ATPase subunit a
LVIVGLLLFISSGFLANLGIGTLLPEPVLPTILLPAEPITATTDILGFRTGFTNTLLATLLADIALVTLAYFGTRKLRSGDESAMVPSGLQNLLEAIVEGLYNLAEGILGTRTRKVFWLGATIFLFVLVANWMELIPGFDSIGWLEHPHEEGITAYQRSELGPIGILKGPAVEPAESDHNASGEGEGHQAEGWVLVPFLRAANTDLNTTLALAVISVVMTQVYSIQALGLNGYLGKFIQTKRIGEGNPMGIIDTFVGVLEAIAEIAKIISFAFRLFGNIFAGAVLLFVMGFLMPFLFPGVMIFYGLELFVGAIQALVFMMLTFVFISAATAAHGEGH